MAILEQLVVEIAKVEVNDEYRVELSQFRETVDYSPDQAEQLAKELLRAVDAVRGMVASHEAEISERSRAVLASEVL